jgi:DNA-binding NtrC family response regulator
MKEPATSSARAHVLIVEDSSVFREMQSLLLRQAGYAISAHEHPHAALAAAKERAYDLVVVDYELPAMNGEQFMHELRKVRPEIAVVFVSGALTLELAIKLSTQGVAGVFHKPVNPKTLLEKINDTVNRSAKSEAGAGRTSNSPLPAARRSNSNSPLATAALATEPSESDLAYRPRHLLGHSPAFRDFTHRLWRVRDFRAVLLLQGEVGSPFELIGRDLAEISLFREGPVMVCDAEQFETRHLIEVLAPTLLSADAGTLIVTGVEKLTTAQQKILESLMTGRDVFLPFARRFRLVLAAAGNFSELADDGRFSDTLYYKISSLSLTVPALREMRDDIPANVRQLLAEHRIALNAPAPLALADDAVEFIQEQPWNGNYAQLSRTLLLAAKRTAGVPISAGVLQSVLKPEVAASAAPVASPTTRSPFPVRPTPAAPTSVSTSSASPASHASSAAVRGAALAKSAAYDFSQRLAAALAAADAVAAL